MLISLTTFASSCNASPRGDVKEEKREVSNFSAIDLAISADVFITQGKGYSVTIEGDSDLLKRIETVVNGNTLRIKTESWTSFNWGSQKVVVKITMPEINGLSCSGSGTIKAVTPITTKSLSTSISGSGTIAIDNLTLSSLEGSISGSGNLRFAGSSMADNASITVSGSGDVSLQGIEFKTATVRVSGSGDIGIKVKENLEARISGSGSVIYEGNPLIDAKVSGSGKIRNK
jgi:hypothetical protein